MRGLYTARGRVDSMARSRAPPSALAFACAVVALLLGATTILFDPAAARTSSGISNARSTSPVQLVPTPADDCSLVQASIFPEYVASEYAGSAKVGFNTSTLPPLSQVDSEFYVAWSDLCAT